MAGSIIVTASDLGAAVVKYAIAWTSDASGNVNTTTAAVKRGVLRNAKFIPGSGGTQPTNLYSVTMIDADGADLLNPTGAAALGASLSNATANWVQPATIVEAGNVTPTVSAAGNAKTGTIVLYIGP